MQTEGPVAELVWTPEQVDAIQSTADTLLVANAGTGKTTTVVGKILWHLGLPFGTDEDGDPIAPVMEPCRLDEIAAITFTEKAAYDLKRKLREEIEEAPRAAELRWELDSASIGTIHSFCGELLREHALRLGIDPTFEILDANEAWTAQDEIIKALVLERVEAGDEGVVELLRDGRLVRFGKAPGLVDYVRSVLRDLRWHAGEYDGWCRGPDPVLDRKILRSACSEEWDSRDDASVERSDTLVRLGREALTRWTSYQAEENVRDFDSLILDVRALLLGPDGEAALGGIRRRYRILIIDEFQDTDFAQRDIAFAIARGVPRPHLFLVGDPKQSIYRFRGANILVWNEVERAFRADGEVLDLSRNFRSAPVIVDYVNDAAAVAMRETGTELGGESPLSRVRYAELVAGVDSDAAAGVEWLVAEEDRADEQREAEAHQVASRILELVDGLRIADPDSKKAKHSAERRLLEFRDIALLYRARTGLEHFETALTRFGIPYFLAGAPHLNERQEVLDVLNALRLLRSPRDDLRAFGYLRSPFVGLRDETLARIRLLGSPGPLLGQAQRFLDESDRFAAPEHAELAEIECESLERGLRAIHELRELTPRLLLDELIEELLERTGYRLHLMLMDRSEEVLANLQSLIHFAEGHRDLDIGTFLDVWERWSSMDAGIPQAPLYSRDDNVVTLSTIHTAKGLEWPVVFFVGVKRNLWQHRANEFWSDHSLGPLLCPRKDDQGPRAQRMVKRDQLETEAEEARLLYVAATRAKDRLVVVGPLGADKGYAPWLEHGVSDERVDVRLKPGEVQPRQIAAPPELSWLDDLRFVPPPSLASPLPEPAPRWIRSASELMIRSRDPEAWERRYVHAVEAPWEFAPETPSIVAAAAATAGSKTVQLDARLRGTLIHGVLERIQEANELARILEETIGALDEPELEWLARPGGAYREALEEEIRRVVESEKWAWYVSGPNWREMQFLHLVGPRDWRIGALDLYRFLEDQAAIIDFKTHDARAEEVEAIAKDYEIQASVYSEAGAIAGPVSVSLHFTKPNAVVAMTNDGPSR